MPTVTTYPPTTAWPAVVSLACVLCAVTVSMGLQPVDACATGSTSCQ